MFFKCYGCFQITDLEICPLCEQPTVKMCKKDHVCTCTTDVSAGIHTCECGENTCPCGSHDVVTISRVTGYLSDTKGWNTAKLAELKDRQRY